MHNAILDDTAITPFHLCTVTLGIQSVVAETLNAHASHSCTLGKMLPKVCFNCCFVAAPSCTKD